VTVANRYGVTPLYPATVNGNAAMIELLLKHGADPNAALPEGETALMTASRTGNADAVKVLASHGAGVNAKESWRGQTALMWAAAENHVAVLATLIERGADINARSMGGLTPLLYAVRAGRIEAVNTLLAAGADVNQTVHWPAPVTTTTSARSSRADADGTAGEGWMNGISALTLAIINARYDLAAILLDKGADVNADGPGWTDAVASARVDAQTQSGPRSHGPVTDRQAGQPGPGQGAAGARSGRERAAVEGALPESPPRYRRKAAPRHTPERPRAPVFASVPGHPREFQQREQAWRHALPPRRQSR
jgi:ankyrin repeat protein